MVGVMRDDGKMLTKWKEANVSVRIEQFISRCIIV